MWGTLKLQNLDINGPDNGGPIVTKFPRWSRLLCVCRRSRLLLLHVSAAQLRRLAVRQACSWTPPQLKYVKSYIWLPKGSAHIMDVYLLTVDSLTKNGTVLGVQLQSVPHHPAHQCPILRCPIHQYGPAISSINVHSCNLSQPFRWFNEPTPPIQ